MSAELPELDLPRFAQELRRSQGSRGPALPSLMVEQFFAFYDELRRWNRRASLIGPGTVNEVANRHFAESLAGLGLLRDSDRTLVDIGSGAGFPGLVLAIARPDLEITLVESREKKWAFLNAVIRRCRLSCRVLNVRVTKQFSTSTQLPETIDVVTSRAVALADELLQPFLARSPAVRFLVWQGDVEIGRALGLAQQRQVVLPGSDRRRIVEWLRPEQHER